MIKTCPGYQRQIGARSHSKRVQRFLPEAKNVVVARTTNANGHTIQKSHIALKCVRVGPTYGAMPVTIVSATKSQSGKGEVIDYLRGAVRPSKIAMAPVR